MMETRQLVVIGGGPAGLAAAAAAREAGIKDILILEREPVLGGILNQCIHNGFGLHTFKEELTGPEYAARYEQRVRELGIEYLCGCMVLSVSAKRVVTAVSADKGLLNIAADAVILAAGCRERPRGGVNTPGARCAGIYAAGTAQKLVNLYGRMPGREAVILGSGDIGLIMARRMVFEGAKVKAVVELMPYSGGLKRNIVQCLDDFDIPLYLSHTVIGIEGDKRVEAVTIAEVDECRCPIKGTERRIECDTLLLSVGLIPENELSRTAGVALSRVTGGAEVDERLMTSVPGFFACGNVLHVHDLVDYVSEESELCGRAAADYIVNGKKASEGASVTVTARDGVRYTVPQRLSGAASGGLTLRLRVDNVYRDRLLTVAADGVPVVSRLRRVLAPGEMETLSLKPNEADKLRNAKRVEVYLEAAGGEEHAG